MRTARLKLHCLWGLIFADVGNLQLLSSEKCFAAASIEVYVSSQQKPPQFAACTVSDVPV
jgi:hypothetical protein